MRRSPRPTPSLLVLVLACATWAAPQPAPPSRERIATLASSLAGELAGRTFRLPDGSEQAVVGEAGSLLDEQRLRTCLETISEAAAWPAAWLVVQDLSRPFDLVLHIVLRDDGSLRPPDVLFAAPRRDWDADALEAAVKDATGKKPARERSRNVVVQGFATKVETTYVYQPPKGAKEKGGLIALLPAGSVLREAKSVDLGDGHYRTLAIALVDGKFVPSSCASCAAKIFGHADTGRILLVLAGETALEDTLDLTPHLRGTGEGALLPRFRCAPGDESPGAREKTYEDRFAGRELVRLLDLTDLNGDGLPLEFSLPSEFIDCDRHASIVAGVDPRSKKLRIWSERMDRS